MGKLDPFLLRDVSQGRITADAVNAYLAPANSVKDSINVNYDVIIGSGVVRAGTTLLGDQVAPGETPLGLGAFSPQTGSAIGAEMVSNGSFTGNANGWTLGAGWAYNSNNVNFTLVGPELITNGTFTGSATGWTLGTGWTYSSNRVNTTGFADLLLQTVSGASPAPGKKYRLSVGAVAGNNGQMTADFGSTSFVNDAFSGTWTEDITVEASSNVFSLSPTGFPTVNAYVGGVDNVSLKYLSREALSQDIGAVAELQYRVSVTAGGTIGSVTAQLGADGPTFTIPAGTTTEMDIFAGGSDIRIIASEDFNGTVDNISVFPIQTSILLAVFSDNPTAILYYYQTDTGLWAASDLDDLTLGQKCRFAVLGNRVFVTNAADGMASSGGGAVWTVGTAADCIDAGDAKPSLLKRYAGRMLAAGDPVYPDRVFFSSIIEPAASPFITWDTDDTTGDWIDVNPDDGGNLTGFGEASTFLLLFKNNGMYRIDAINKTVDPENIFNVGAVSQEAIVTCQGVAYFFSGLDVRRTNGGYPEQISRLGVQDIIDAVPQANWEHVAAGTDGLNVWFNLGDVTLNPNTDQERLISNCQIKFSPRDETWSVHSYADEFWFYVDFTDEDGTRLRGATANGDVQTIDEGVRDRTGLVVAAADASEPISYELESQDLEFGNRAHLKGVSDKLVVFAKDGAGGQVEFRVDGGDAKSVPIALERRVNIGKDINLEGHFFNFRWFGVAGDVAPTFEGLYLESINDKGMTQK